MNILMQIFVFTTVVAVALCVLPVTDTNAGVGLVMKAHKLHRAGLVTRDVVADICDTFADDFFRACKDTPLEPLCTAAGAAFGIYINGQWNWDGLQDK